MSRPTIGAWVKPPNDSLKFNVDVSVKSNYDEACIGGCLRDHTGSIYRAFNGLTTPLKRHNQAECLNVQKRQ
ncbi:hypothetical protein V6N13_013772 [Hibiscus sabdariffa]|uniref:Uncharacterized protein n=2 Tax=Hibiscus sabdariffa TaxID=183260 RepID=A0ABR2BWE8_9ROSI